MAKGKGNGYSVKQKIDYHNKQAKPGAVSANTGNKLTDFHRGTHKGKADSLIAGAKSSYRNADKGIGMIDHKSGEHVGKLGLRAGIKGRQE